MQPDVRRKVGVHVGLDATRYQPRYGRPERRVSLLPTKQDACCRGSQEVKPSTTLECLSQQLGRGSIATVPKETQASLAVTLPSPPYSLDQRRAGAGFGSEQQPLKLGA
jgi:hypothetical protein